MSSCPSCGKELREGAKFCPNCGHQLPQVIQAPLTSPPPSQVQSLRRHRNSHALIVGIAAVIVVILVIALVYEFYLPRIVMTDITTSDATNSCGIIFHNPQTVGASFTLVNTGRVDAVVVVRMTGGGGTLAQNTYVVPAGQSSTKNLAVSVDCSLSFTVSVWIVSVSHT